MTISRGKVRNRVILHCTGGECPQPIDARLRTLMALIDTVHPATAHLVVLLVCKDHGTRIEPVSGESWPASHAHEMSLYRVYGRGEDCQQMVMSWLKAARATLQQERQS